MTDSTDVPGRVYQASRVLSACRSKNGPRYSQRPVSYLTNDWWQPLSAGGIGRN
jgi:hypothetical protein